MASNYNSIAMQFVEYYYNLFQSNRISLASLFNEQSLMTFENEQYMGVENIIKKLSELPPQSSHQILTLDAQPTLNNTILVLVTGVMKIDETTQMKFSSIFNLVPLDGGSYLCMNKLFRLNMG